MQPCSFIDFPGHLAAVLFTQGCNLRCRYCHNPGLCGKPRAGRIGKDSVISLLDSRRGKLTGIVASGGEPTLHTCLPMLLRTVRERGFATKLDTNGTNPRATAALLDEGLVDFLAVDVKVAPGTSSRWLCGIDGQAESALQTLKIATTAGAACEARTTLVRDQHDIPELKSIASALASVGVRNWRLQPVKSGRVLDQNCDLSPPDASVIAAALDESRRLGLHAIVRNSGEFLTKTSGTP